MEPLGFCVVDGVPDSCRNLSLDMVKKRMSRLVGTARAVRLSTMSTSCTKICGLNPVRPVKQSTRLQVVAVNWIFSFRIKFVGFGDFFWGVRGEGGSGLFLTFWRSLGVSE